MAAPEADSHFDPRSRALLRVYQADPDADAPEPAYGDPMDIYKRSMEELMQMRDQLERRLNTLNSQLHSLQAQLRFTDAQIKGLKAAYEDEFEPQKTG